MILGFIQSNSSPKQLIRYLLLFLAFLTLSYSPNLFADNNKIYYYENKDDITALLQDALNGIIKPDHQMDNGLTALMIAAINGWDNELEMLLDKETDINKKDRGGFTALMYASRKGKQKAVEILLEKRADPNIKSKVGATARSLAITHKFPHIADLIAKKGGIATQFQVVIQSILTSYLEKFSSLDPVIIKKFKERQGLCYGLTSLWLYGKWLDNQPENSDGHNNFWFRNTIKDIIEWNGTDELPEKLPNFENFTSLLTLFQSPEAQLDLEKIMLSSGLDTKRENLKRKYSIVSKFDLNQLCTLLEKIVYDDEFVRIIYVLKDAGHVVGIFKHGSDYYYYDSNNHSGEIKTKSIVELAQNIIDSNEGNSSLGFIVNSFEEKSNLYPKQEEFLAEINSPADNDSLVTSAFIGCLDSLKFFLDKGADPNLPNALNKTALFEASRLGNISIVEALLEKKADPNKKLEVDGYILTPLVITILNRHEQVAEKLLEHGANPYEEVGGGATALILAADTEQPNIVAKILKSKYKTELNKQENTLGFTALMTAAGNGDAKTVRMLLENGADLTIKNNEGLKAIDIAKALNKTECANILEGYQNRNKNIDL